MDAIELNFGEEKTGLITTPFTFSGYHSFRSEVLSMKAKTLYPDRHDEIWPGISKGKAAFLQKRWTPTTTGGSLRYQGFDFILYPWSSKAESWGGEVTRTGFESEKLLPKGAPMSILEAKATLYDKMVDMKKQHRIKADIEKRRV
jgi:hypothetical protein